MTEMVQKKIVILGAGVSGLRIAQKLGKKITSEEAKITLIDQNNYHQFLYKIHEVCNLEYEEKDIIVPLSRLLKDNVVEFIQTSVENVIPSEKVVKTSERDFTYDILVIALGSHVAYFGIEGIEENSMTLDSYDSAKKLRAKIRDLFTETEGLEQIPKIIIGGGGFTGVELAGEICDSLPQLSKKYNLENPGNWVTIVEALPTILPGWDKKQVLKAQDILRSRGVVLILNDPIVTVYPEKLELKSGTILEPNLFIWTGGVRGDPACGLDFEIMNRRIVVDEYCRTTEYDDIYVAGDSACAVDQTGQPMPPTAHIAMIQADIVINNIFAQLKGGALKKYVYNRAGEIVTLGKNNAIGDLFGLKLSGSLATFVKKVVHWWYLHAIGGFNLLLN